MTSFKVKCFFNIHTLILLSFLFISSYLFGQKSVALSGYITDKESNETLFGVNVIFPELQFGTITNEYGFYSISLPKGVHEIRISYLGFNGIQQEINIEQELTQNFKLAPSFELLDEVIVQDDVEKLNIKSPQMSVNKLAINTIKSIPA